MDRFLQYKRKGLMNIDKQAEMNPVYKRICTEMQEEYPEYAQFDIKIVTKYKICKRRYREQLTVNRFNINVDENGLMQAFKD